MYTFLQKYKLLLVNQINSILDFYRYDLKFHFTIYCIHLEYTYEYVSEFLERNSTGSIVQ